MRIFSRAVAFFVFESIKVHDKDRTYVLQWSRIDHDPVTAGANRDETSVYNYFERVDCMNSQRRAL